MKMKLIAFPKILIVAILVLLTPHFLFGQTCACTLNQVVDNTVVPCSKIIGVVDTVSTVGEFQNAINQANNSGGNRTILIEDGVYAVASTASYPYIVASDLVIRSLSGNRNDVVLTGSGMASVAPGTEIVLSAQGNNITIADLTIRDVGNHGISVQADSLFVHNVRIQNTYEQMIKGTSGGNGSHAGVVQCCLLEYTTGIGPQFYIGGLDIHKGINWRVNDNVFRDIASPAGSVAEHAVHFWNNSADNIVERNWIINCDRGVGFGLGGSPSSGGIIRNNMIYNAGVDPFNDAGISLETSPNTKVYNNTIHIAYQNAIEYRFAATNGVSIVNNLCNQAIQSRDGGQATLTTNLTNAQGLWYNDITNGDLRLSMAPASVVDQGTDLDIEVPDDLDQILRPQGVGYDIGADEYDLSVSMSEHQSKEVLTLYPNPANTRIEIRSGAALMRMQIFDPLGKLVLDPVSMNTGVDVSKLGTGTYFLKATDVHGTRYTLRFVIR